MDADRDHPATTTTSRRASPRRWKAWAGSSGPTEKTELPSWLTVWADAVGASSTLTTAVVIEYAKAVDERHVKSSAAMLGFIGSQLGAVVASGHADNIIDAIPQFVDAIETWANVDPETGEIVSGEEEYTDVGRRDRRPAALRG